MVRPLMSCDYPRQDTLVDFDRRALRTVCSRLVRQTQRAWQQEDLTHA
jgi:hypothetical protein